MEDTELLRKLLKKRSGYDDDVAWEKFLMDAYGGTGGFQGRVRMPYAGFWGAGSELYAQRSAGIYSGATSDEAAIDTYLDRYPREETPKFQRRAAAANYPNPVEPVVDIRLSYIHRKPMKRSGVEDDRIERFLKDADGDGTPWDQLLHETIHVRAEVHGHCPVLFDMPAIDVETQAQAAEAGVRAKAIPLFMAQLYDWHFEDGQLEFVKIGTFYEERADALSEPVCVHQVAIWYRDRVETYEIVKEQGKGQDIVRDKQARPNRWGVIPLVVFVHKAAQMPLRGVSGIGNIAKQGKRLLNYESENDEHLRSSVFALLQVPTDDPDKLGTVLAGSGMAMPVKTSSSRDYQWIETTGNVSTAYEKRIAETLKVIREMARTEYGANESKAAKSGTSRAFEFENMNRSLADIAICFAAGDQASLRLVGSMEGMSEEQVEEILVVPPKSFDVEDMAKELEAALSAKSLGIGPTAIAEVKKRLVRNLLPNWEPELQAKSDQEIDDLATEEEHAAAAARELLTNPPDDDPEKDPPEDDPPGKVPPKKPPPPKA